MLPVFSQEKPEPPHKYVVDRVEVHLQSLLFVVDMEGLSDGRALKTILPQINPRKLVRRVPSPRFPNAADSSPTPRSRSATRRSSSTARPTRLPTLRARAGR